MIDTNELLRHHAKSVFFSKGEIIFMEDEHAKYYFQILKGGVKMINYKDDGKLYIQGVFSDGESFGEPPLFVDKPYPASAIANCDSEILRMSKENFFNMLENEPTLYAPFVNLLSLRLFQKSNAGKSLSQSQPEIRIESLLNQVKDRSTKSNIDKTLICLTRQEIADFTGLRVETVIRALKKMHKERTIEIKDRKVYI